MIFSDNRIHIDRGVDEDSVSEVEVVVKANNKHLSSTQIIKFVIFFKLGKSQGWRFHKISLFPTQQLEE